MKLLATLAALLIEQGRPLRRDNRVHAAWRRCAQYLRDEFDAGQYRQGVAAWLLAVVPLTLLTMVGAWLLSHLNPVSAWLFAVGVLYLTTGFRGFSNFFSEVQRLLKGGEIAQAREQLGRWRRADCSALDAQALARVAIEQGLIDSHRGVFGPLMWFFAAGPAGALLYRLAALLREQWTVPPKPDVAGEAAPRSEFAHFAARAFEIIDWLPARLTAASFAVAGNFQDAVDCWRTQAAAWPDAADGILLASGAGALGVKLGGELNESGAVHFRPDIGTGDEVDTDFLASAVGLVWRTLVMWVLLAAVVTIGNLLG
jgi:adenosylcobinamide-phosphate synthase